MKLIPVPFCIRVATLSSTRSLVKYKFDDPSDTLSLLKEIFALPLKATPLMVLVLANIVAVGALPVMSPVNKLLVVKLIPVVIQALLAEFLIFKTPLLSSIHHS